jgi:hypothetical protein
MKHTSRKRRYKEQLGEFAKNGSGIISIIRTPRTLDFCVGSFVMIDEYGLAGLAPSNSREVCLEITSMSKNQEMRMHIPTANMAGGISEKDENHLDGMFCLMVNKIVLIKVS